MSDQMEVCLLSQGGDVAFRFNPYSRHYSTTFAYSILLYPPSHRHTLRLPTLTGPSGLTVFRLDNRMG